MHLAHPLGVKMFGYQRVKTDARDSTNLAQPLRMLRMHRLPEAWLAPPQVRQLRELVRYRAKLVALRGGLKAQVHTVLRQARRAGADERPMSDLFGVGAPGCWTNCGWRAPTPFDALRIASLRSLLAAYDQEIEEIAMLGREISTALAGEVGYLVLPGHPDHPRVGPVLAAVFVTEIGDVGRFVGAPPLRSWAGLTPATTSPTPPCAVAPSPSRAPGWSAGPRSRRSSGSQRLPAGSKQAADSPPTSTASATGAAPASAASPPPASC